MTNGIYVKGPKRHAIKQYQEAILDILESDCDNLTKQIALKVLHQGVHITVSHCTVNGGHT